MGREGRSWEGGVGEGGEGRGKEGRVGRLGLGLGMGGKGMTGWEVERGYEGEGGKEGKGKDQRSIPANKNLRLHAQFLLFNAYTVCFIGLSH